MAMHLRKVGLATAVVVLATVAGSADASAQAMTTTPAASGPSADVPVAEFLRQTLDGLGFQEVVDLAPPATTQFKALNAGVDTDATTPEQRARQYAAAAAAPQPIFQQPQIDASVLELDDAGRIVSSGTVLMS